MRDYNDALKKAIAGIPKAPPAIKKEEPSVKGSTGAPFPYYILDENGINPIEASFDDWRDWQVVDQDFGWSRVDGSMPRSPVSGREFYVSTVFLLVSHGTSPEGEPILWETMVFDSNGEEAAVNEVYCGRCAGTREDAEQMHRITVAAVQSGVIPGLGTL